MVRFDEEEQQKRLKELRDGEEENLIASLAGSTYGISYIDLTAQSIDNDAIRLLTEDEAKSMEVRTRK
jgi:hypothetical protein